GHRRVIARRDEHPGPAILDNLRDPARAGGDNGARTSHRIEDRRPEALSHRAHREEIEPLDAAEDVGPEAGQQHMFLEVMLADLAFEMIAQLALAQNHEARVRN